MIGRPRPISFWGVVKFLIIWLFTGFTLGTITLMYVVRTIVTYTRENNWTTGSEDFLVKATIVVLVVVSLVVARKIYRKTLYATNKTFRFILFVSPIVTSALCLILWMNPKIMQFDSTVTRDIFKDKEFVFGPYPDEEKIIELKKENFDGIISLLHKAVVPFEPKLLAEEKKLAEANKIRLIHIPLIPWISENEESLKKLKTFAQQAKGKYYVHCYLGKDRVAVAKRIIQSAVGGDYISGQIYARKLDSLRKFERGKLMKLDDSVYISPYPTEEEYFFFVVNGSIKQVVSLLTHKVPEDIKWINAEKEFIEQYLVDYQHVPLDLFPYDPFKVVEDVKRIKTMNYPLLIHSFLVPSPQTDIFINTYANGYPSLHTYLFHEMLVNGPVEVINQNTALGPRPKRDEFGDYLYYLGIRSVAYVGANNSWAETDKINAERSRLSYHVFSPADLGELDKNTTWFVYGASPDTIKKYTPKKLSQ